MAAPTAWQRGRTAVSTRTDQVSAWFSRTRERNVVVDIGMRLRERDQEAAGTIAGSAVAFRLFLFFVPTMLVVVALAGFLAGHLSADSVSSNVGVSGVMAKQIESAFSQPSTTRWVALLTGLLGMFSAGRSLAKTLVLAGALSWRVSPGEQKATMRVTGIVIGVMVSVGLCAVLVNRVRQRFGIAMAGASFFGAMGAYFLVWLALSLVLPRRTRDPGALLPGAALMGVAMAALQAVTQLYIPGKLDKASALYGSLGITIVTLGWFFIIGRFTVLSATINAVVFERLGSVSTLVFRLPILRALPKRSSHLAHWFGLDDDGGHTVD